MKKWMINKWMVSVLTACLALPAMAQQDSLKDLPGYIDFGEMSAVYGEPKVMINIGGSILNFVVKMADEGDGDTADMMKNLKGVRIQVYSTEGQDATAALDQVSTMKGILSAQNWEPIVQVNEDGEQAQIFLKLSDDQMQGLAVMAVNEEEAVFINIIGMLDPAQLGQVMDNFDIDIDDHVEVD